MRDEDLILTHKARVNGVLIDWPHGPIGAMPGDPNARLPEGFAADLRDGERQRREAKQATDRLAATMQVQWFRDRLAVATAEAEKRPPLVDLNPIGRSRRRAAQEAKLAQARSVVADLTEDLNGALEAARKLGLTDEELRRPTPQVWEGRGKRYVYTDRDGAPVPFGSPAATFSFPSEEDPKLAKLRASRGNG